MIDDLFSRSRAVKESRGNTRVTLSPLGRDERKRCSDLFYQTPRTASEKTSSILSQLTSTFFLANVSSRVNCLLGHSSWPEQRLELRLCTTRLCLSVSPSRSFPENAELQSKLGIPVITGEGLNEFKLLPESACLRITHATQHLKIHIRLVEEVKSFILNTFGT